MAVFQKGKDIVVRAGMAQENPVIVSYMNHPIRKSLWVSDEEILYTNRKRAMRQGFCFRSLWKRDIDHRTF